MRLMRFLLPAFVGSLEDELTDITRRRRCRLNHLANMLAYGPVSNNALFHHSSAT